MFKLIESDYPFKIIAPNYLIFLQKLCNLAV
jgi:hypothetical protein